MPAPTSAPVEILPPFDYAAVPAEHRSAVEDTTANIHTLLRRTHATYLEIGGLLVEGKRRLGHGHFGAWIAAEFGFTDKTATNMMSAFREFGAESETISILPQAVVYKLAAPSVPQAVKNEVIDRLGAGERIAPQAVLDLIAEAKEAKAKEDAKAREEARLAKMTPEQIQAEKKQRQSRAKREEAKRLKREEERREEAEESRQCDANRAQLARLLASRFSADDEAEVMALRGYEVHAVQHLLKQGRELLAADLIGDL